MSAVLLLVADALKDGMALRSFFADFETVRPGVRINGCSLWIKPYDPVPLIVFNPRSPDVAVGDVIKAPTVDRLLDFVNFQSNLYPHHQRMVLGEIAGQNEVPCFSFFYSQVQVPAVISGYVKIESGEFTKDVYDGLWDSAIADNVWCE